MKRSSRTLPILARIVFASAVMAAFWFLALMCRLCWGHPMEEPCALAGAFWAGVILWR